MSDESELFITIPFSISSIIFSEVILVCGFLPHIHSKDLNFVVAISVIDFQSSSVKEIVFAIGSSLSKCSLSSWAVLNLSLPSEIFITELRVDFTAFVSMVKGFSFSAWRSFTRSELTSNVPCDMIFFLSVN